MDAWARFGLAALGLAASRTSEGDSSADRASALTAEADAARDALHEEFDGDSAFAALVGNANLVPTEAEVLAVLATLESHPLAQHLLGTLQADTGPSRIALHALAAVFEPTPVSALGVGPDGRLRRAGLAEVGATPDTPWLDQRVYAHPSVVWGLLGDPGRDPELPVDLRDEHSDEAGTAWVAVVTGSDVARRRRHAADVLRGERFLVTRPPDTEAGWVAIVREATLTGRGVIVELDDTLPLLGRRWVERADHLAWGLAAARELPLTEMPERPWVASLVPDVAVTEAEWKQHLGDAPREHRLTLTQIELVERARGAYGGDVSAAIRRLVSGRMEKVTRRVRPRYEWGDLVLSPERKDSLRALANRYRDSARVYDEWGFAPTPSRGTVALFSGPSGTGKSMAAEVLAGELHLDLFKLDLSAVVSKYIGETEKNLEEVFDAAGTGNLLLFFDEADALFGKRSEVKDARDRYANVEVSYLLQRLEVYDGIIVLATNFERNIDEAFLRRVHARIDFASPGPDERRAIWEANLPSGAPVEGVDTEWLAQRFELTGGQIRNAAVQAAFLAAQSDAPLSMEFAVRGVAQEMRKQGRLIKPADFAEYGDLINDAAPPAPTRGRSAR